MEGLMLARVLEQLDLPAQHLGWSFPDETTAVLRLVGKERLQLVFVYRPPQPMLFLSTQRFPENEPHNGFQRALQLRLQGDLLRVQQLKLDRVVLFDFAESSGFVQQPPARLLFEVTGRNTNLLLLEQGDGFSGKIQLAAREITSQRNRYRTTRSGGMYVPPPPYEKIDPRTLTEQQAEQLSTIPLFQWRQHLDGIGPLLGAELANRSGLDPQQAPQIEWLRVWNALQTLVKDPTLSDSYETAQADKIDQLRKILRVPLSKRISLINNQLADVTRAKEGLQEAQIERAQADLLMAYAYQVPAGAHQVTLPQFDGQSEEQISLRPELNAVQNAQKRYARAKRREEVYERLLIREPVLQRELIQAEQDLTRLEQASLQELTDWHRQLSAKKESRMLHGARYESPSGYEIWVGRNSRENVTLTHRIGKSMDWWFHAQGYTGSHVLLRSGGKELDLPDILYAAQLAATYSKAKGSTQVPVDYTRIKHVWRVKGAAPGQVQYSHQKTVFVTGELPDTAVLSENGL